MEFGPPAPTAASDHVGMGQEAVEEGGDRGGVAEQLVPVPHGAVGGRNRGRPLVAAHDWLQQLLGGGGGQLPYAQVVDEQEGDGTELSEHRLSGAIQHSMGQILQQLHPASPAGAVAWRPYRRRTDLRVYPSVSTKSRVRRYFPVAGSRTMGPSP